MSSVAAFDHVDATASTDRRARRRRRRGLPPARRRGSWRRGATGSCRRRDAGEARCRLEDNGDVAAVLCDIRMPGMSGLDLLREIAQDFPDVAVLMTTGARQSPRRRAGLRDRGVRLRRQALRSQRADHQPRRRAAPARARDGPSQSRSATSSEQRPGRDGSRASSTGSRARHRRRSDDTVRRLAHAVSLRGDAAAVHLERMSRYCADPRRRRRPRPPVVRGDAARRPRCTTSARSASLTACSRRPGPLTSDEHMIKQRHARLGYELLAGSRSPLIAVAADIALTPPRVVGRQWVPAGPPGRGDPGRGPDRRGRRRVRRPHQRPAAPTGDGRRRGRGA